MADLLCAGLAVGACLILASNVMAVAFKAKNDLPTTWADVKSMVIWNANVGVVLVFFAAAVVVLS